MNLNKPLRNGVASLAISVRPAPSQAAQGLTPPEPIAAWGQIDTGAKICVIGAALADMLQLVPIADTTATGPQIGEVLKLPCAKMIITVTDEAGNPASVEVWCCILDREIWRGDDMLLGRDFLSHFRFVYDGPGDRFELHA